MDRPAHAVDLFADMVHALRGEPTVSCPLPGWNAGTVYRLRDGLETDVGIGTSTPPRYTAQPTTAAPIARPASRSPSRNRRPSPA